MSVPYSPPSARQLLQAKRKRILKIVGMVLSAVMVVAMLTVLALIVRNERAHNEDTCKFVTLSQRSLGKATVVEQSRSCLPERPAAKTFELARKRLPRANFAADRYVWTVREDKSQQLVVRIELNGKLMSEFFEEDAHP
jgi:hypothetical protein